MSNRVATFFRAADGDAAASPAGRPARAAAAVLRPLAQQQPPTAWDRAVEVLLACLLVFAPLAYGASEPWSQEVVLGLTALMALFVGLRLTFRPDLPAVRTWALLPVGLFLLVVLLQVVPLPEALLRAVSPNAVRLKAELAADPAAGAAPAAASGWATLTFYPWATLRDLRLILVPAALFWVVLNVYRRPEQVRRLLLTMAVAGLATASVAVYQNVTGDRTIYGVTPTEQPNSGPFVCHSHFGQFINLSIGATLGLLLSCVRAGGDEAAPDAPDQGFWTWSWLPWALGFTAIVGGVTVVLSLTRGGTSSMLLAGTAVGLLLAVERRSRGKGTLLLALGGVLLAGLLYAGFDQAYERMASLRAVHSDGGGGRWQILQDLSAVWRLHPLLGTGLGTHEVVFPAYKQRVAETITTHAENEYAQLMEEAGAVGLVLALCFLGLVVLGFVRAVRGPDHSLRTAAFGLGFGLLAILVHSFTDFGQHLPAVAAMTAVTCALLVRLGLDTKAAAAGGDLPSHAPEETHPRTPAKRWPAVLRGAVACVAVLAVSGWAIAGIEKVRQGAEAWDTATAMESGIGARGWDEATNDEMTDLLTTAESAVALDPGNINYRYGLNLFRWRAISRITAPGSGEVLLTPETQQFARQIATDLQAVKALCPTFGLVHSLAGQIRWFVLNDPAGKTDVRTGLRLAPYHSAVCLTAGHLEVTEGRWDAAQPLFARAIQLNTALSRDVLRRCVGAGKLDIARSLATGDRDRLLTLAAELEGDEQTPATPARSAAAAACRREADQLLESAASATDAAPAMLAALAEQKERAGDPAAATDLYRRALAGDYAQVGWRIRLAKLLAAVGRNEEAVREARLCLRLRPQMPEATALIDTLGSGPDGTGAAGPAK